MRRGDGDKLGINFPYFSIKTYVVTHHYWNRLAETVLMRGHNIQ